MLLSLLAVLPLAVPVAGAHGSEFGLDGVSAVPGHDEQIWAQVRDSGLVHTVDGGETWAWYCDEASSMPQIIEDIEALDDGRVLVAAVGGLYLYDADCGTTKLPGLPADSNTNHIRRYGDRWLVAGVTGEAVGIFVCTVDGCAESDLVDTTSSVQAIVVDGETAWATVVDRETDACTLWRSEDGAHWTLAYSWSNLTFTPAILSARGDRLLVWSSPLSAYDAPFLTRSEDAGQTWTSVLAFGTFNDDFPTFTSVGGAFLYLSNNTFSLFQSIDDGATWTDLNAGHIEQPTLRCASDDGRYVCGGHYDDGWDLGKPVGFSFEGVSCIQHLESATCATVGEDGATCAQYVENLLSSVGEETAQCDVDLSAPAAGGCCADGADTGGGTGGGATSQSAAGAIGLLAMWVSARVVGGRGGRAKGCGR